MTALRPFSLRAALTTLTLFSIVAGTDRPTAAQATRPVTPPAREKARKTEKKEAQRTVEVKPAEQIDLNSATIEELMTLPGIGEVTARKVIDGRPHTTIEDLSRLGVSARRIDEIKPLAKVRPIPEAVDLNNDPLIRLQTLPGVGPSLAQEILAARPLATYDDLAKVKGVGPAKVDSLKGRVKFGKPAASKAETKAKTEKNEPKAKTEPKTKSAKKAEEAGEPGSKVNLNTASLEELDSLPGIGMVLAQAIVAARPFDRPEDVMKIKGIKEVEFAKLKDRITVGK